MSIKKELLNELNEQELRDLAQYKGIKFKLNKVKKEYYEGWDEREKIIDIMSDKGALSVREIEEFIKTTK